LGSRSIGPLRKLAQFLLSPLEAGLILHRNYCIVPELRLPHRTSPSCPPQFPLASIYCHHTYLGTVKCSRDRRLPHLRGIQIGFSLEARLLILPSRTIFSSLSFPHYVDDADPHRLHRYGHPSFQTYFSFLAASLDSLLSWPL
jgi:hypothetical protein